MGIHAESRSVQCERARTYHDLREFGGWKCLCDSHSERSEDILQKEFELCCGATCYNYDAGVGVWVGWDFQAILG